MSLFSGGGKGNSEAKTEQVANNEQVAATGSGIAFGAKSSDNTVNISSSDPEVAKAALYSNAATAGSAFDFAGHSADVAAAVNRSAITSLENVSEFSISAGNNLASKFIDGVGKQAANQIELLQSVGQQNTSIALQAQRASSAALESAFGVSKSVAPQDPNFALQTLTGQLGKYAIVIVGIIVLGLFFIIGRKRA